MKKKNLLIAAGVLAASLAAAGCSNHIGTALGSGSVYDSGVYVNTDNQTGFLKFSYGMRYLKVDMELTSGKISEVDIKEVFSPMAWARIDLADYEGITENDYISIDDMYVDETTKGTVYFAKYIQIGDFILEGSVRNNTNSSDNSANYRYCRYGQSVVWKWVDIPSSENSSTNYPLDLDAYLSVDTSTYKLYSRMLWYIECLEEGDAHILTSYNTETKAYTEHDPNYPEGHMYRNDLSTETEFAAGVDALEGFMIGRQLAFEDRSEDSEGNFHYPLQTIDGTWNYNPAYAKGDFSDNNWEPITGLSSSILTEDQLTSYFSVMNICFASCEFESMI